MNHTLNTVNNIIFDDQGMAVSYIYNGGTLPIPAIKPPLLYVNYRVVSLTHISQLKERVLVDIKEELIGGRTTLIGVASLPGGYIVSQSFNSSTDMSTGDRLLQLSLSTAANDKLWELEGYRLYRNINTLDSLIAACPSSSSQDLRWALDAMANSASVICEDGLAHVILAGNAYSNLNDFITPGIVSIPESFYLVARAIMRTYLSTVL